VRAESARIPPERLGPIQNFRPDDGAADQFRAERGPSRRALCRLCGRPPGLPPDRIPVPFSALGRMRMFHGRGVPFGALRRMRVFHGRGVPFSALGRMRVFHGRGVPFSALGRMRVFHGRSVSFSALGRMRVFHGRGVPFSDLGRMRVFHRRGVSFSALGRMRMFHGRALSRLMGLRRFGIMPFGLPLYHIGDVRPIKRSRLADLRAARL
jgi:hypothetical protein